MRGGLYSHQPIPTRQGAFPPLARSPGSEPRMEGQPAHFPAIPGYQLKQKLGEGGMGTVYLAVKLGLMRNLAVKLLHPPPGGQVALCALRREARLMGALSHPGVVLVYDYGEVGGQPYLVMEYVN